MNVLKRRQALGPQTRDIILDATERLLARFGYKKTTMDDLAREAGIGKGSIYLYFPSKEEVVLSSIERIVARLLDCLRDIARGPGPAPERLRQMLLTRVLFRFDSVRDYSQSLDDLLASLRTAYLARRQRYFNEEAEVLAHVLRDGCDQGVFAPLADPLRTAHTLILATNALLPSSLSTRELGKRKDVQENATRIADLLQSGLLSRT
jgi:AcrR family transcriptional regulator